MAEQSRTLSGRNRLATAILFTVAASFGLMGCDTTGIIIGSVVGTTALLGLSPSNEVDQVYYLGVFDPQEQVPPTVYRVRVRGQASALSFMRFGSGWVPASVVDSLGNTIQAGTQGVTISKTGQDLLPTLPTGRKLMMFGPEGFREAPKDHRLVLVMGADPKSYFQAIESVIGDVSEAVIDQQGYVLDRQLFEALLRVKSERDRLNDLEIDLLREFPTAGEVKR